MIDGFTAPPSAALRSRMHAAASIRSALRSPASTERAERNALGSRRGHSCAKTHSVLCLLSYTSSRPVPVSCLPVVGVTRLQNASPMPISFSRSIHRQTIDFLRVSCAKDFEARGFRSCPFLYRHSRDTFSRFADSAMACS
jgi:hypothetical protein